MHPKREKDICNAVKVFFSVWKNIPSDTVLKKFLSMT